jgi:hypothetical protein
MKNPVVEFKEGLIAVRCEGAGLDEKRKPDDTQKFDEWIKLYQKALTNSDNSDILLDIGQNIFDWLNGSENWLETAIRAFDNKRLMIEFVVPEKPANHERSFLETPWELLADAGGHLAKNPGLFYNPVRRIGQKEPNLNTFYNHRLSAIFMTAAPILRNGPALKYEDQEKAILDIIRNTETDFYIEESGTPELLAQSMASHKPVDLLHIVSQGTNRSVPSLMLENDKGEKILTSADQLSEALSGNFPNLLFLSTSVKSKPYKFLNSFSCAVIDKGMPAVVGWPGFVASERGRRFTALVYKNLSLKDSLESSFAGAREMMIIDDKECKDWHLPRLYLGRKGGGQFPEPEHTRDCEPNKSGHMKFLDAKGKQIPVTGKGQFAGRRRQIQSILREFHTHAHAGVVIQGNRGLGKSSLAKRVADSMTGHEVVVLYRRYDALTILEAFGKSMSGNSVRAIVECHRERVKKDASFLTVALNEILSGPCRDVLKNKNGNIESCPALLVIDDFERALESDSDGFNTVSPEFKQAIQFVIEAFKNADTRSRLLFTSRYTFTLSSKNQIHDLAKDLYWVYISPVEEYEAEKIAANRVKTAKKKVDSDHIFRCIRIAHGNPGLLSLILGMSIEAAEKAESTLSAMENFMKSGNISQDRNLLDFLENLAIRNIMSLLTPDEKEIIRTGTLFHIPIPVEIFEPTAKDSQTTDKTFLCERLTRFGLFDPFYDPIAKNNTAVSVNPLISLQVLNLDPEERRLTVRRIINELFNRWGGTREKQRPHIVDFELTRLAIETENTSVIVASAANAAQWLKSRFLHKDAANFCKRAINILDNANVSVFPDLLTIAGEQCLHTGDMENARSFLLRAIKAYRNIDQPTHISQAFDCANTLLTYGILLIQDRMFNHSLFVLKSARDLLEKKDQISNPGIMSLEIDKIHEHNENQLQIGQVPSDLLKALGVTLEKIAGIKNDMGKVHEALKLGNIKLMLFHEFGDTEPKAKALWDTAKVEIENRLLHDAYKHLEKSYSIYMELLNTSTLHLKSACSVGLLMGYMLCAAGLKDKGLEILNFSIEGFKKLGENKLVQRVEAMIRVFS